MSLGFSGPDKIPSIIPSSRTTDGGAGNLGYFQQEKKKKKDKKDENDVLELSVKKDEKETGENFWENKPENLGTKIKTLWFNFKGIFSEAVDEIAEDKTI